MSKTADTPQAKGSLGLKGAGPKTESPCSLCKATQSNIEGDVGGEIGDSNYDIVANRRTRQEVEHGRSRLLGLGFGSKEAVELSKKLGVVEPHPALLALLRALWDLQHMHNPMLCVGPEKLHLNDLVSTTHLNRKLYTCTSSVPL